MRVLGLTGGIGAGKTLVAKRFAEQGIPVLDADTIARETIEPGGDAEQRVRERFGEAIVTDDRIDREKLAAIVFNDPDSLADLNGIIHPLVDIAVARRASELEREGYSTILVEAALHGENGTLKPTLNGLILVMCPESIRIDRLVKYRGMDESEARRRIQAQVPPEKKLPLAGWVIHNDAGEEHVYQQIDALAKELRG